ncbi:MAG: hypothetical protein EZS28_018555 [Streblomastix strix]|uniref:Protein kinase domain-containing protein n=1 Tax=Streblomastix strix TaxID=222440 RepID=A0A5J4VU04_9EUKA|nr:MAG: hypothetical protein EZS28_018555 [Streblomastix strix]
MMDCEDIIRRERHIPIRLLGSGVFGHVYQTYSLEEGMIAMKILQKNSLTHRELEAAVKLHNSQGKYPVFLMEYANISALSVFSRQSNIHLSSTMIRALMKQIIEGMSSSWNWESLCKDFRFWFSKGGRSFD